MQRMVAAELELVASLDEDMAEDDEDRMASTECILKLQALVPRGCTSPSDL